MTEHFFDVVVVGAGAAGLPAAYFAARRGAKVALVEADNRVGGTLPLSTGQISAAGTKLQKEQGIEDSPERHFKDAMRINHGTGDHRLMRTFFDNASDTLEWLMENGWTPLDGHPTTTPGHEIYDVPRTYWSRNPGQDLVDAMMGALKPLIEQGSVTLMLQTKMDRLLHDGGSVTGIAATDKNGAELHLMARAVMLTCGGYAHSESFWRELHGRPQRGWCNPMSQGDGLRAARDLGAKLDDYQNFLPTFASSRDIDEPDKFWINTMTTPQYREPWEIFVNLEGERFVAEDNPSVDIRERALIKQTDWVFWAIFDQHILDESPSFFAPWSYNDEKVERAFASGHPDFQKADTLAGLARACGLDQHVLARTVRRYNAGQAVGSDAFGRKHMPLPIQRGPFYAVKHYGIAVASFGGLCVDGDFRVLRGDGSPIPNLYAAGEVLGLGKFGNAYLGGTAIGPAITFARLCADRHLAWGQNAPEALRAAGD